VKRVRKTFFTLASGGYLPWPHPAFFLGGKKLVNILKKKKDGLSILCRVREGPQGKAITRGDNPAEKGNVPCGSYTSTGNKWGGIVRNSEGGEENQTTNKNTEG